MDDQALSRGSALLRQHLEREQHPATFTLLDHEWDLLPNVFSPEYTPVTELFTSWLPYPQGGSFLEMGSGAGVTAVVGAMSGCCCVTAVDISPTAVENTRLNAERHGVEGRLRSRVSDVFSALDDDEVFDLIFWNSNFVETPAESVNETDLHHAFFDPEYAAHRRYINEASRHLSADGRLFLGFSDLGNWSKLEFMCNEAGLDIEITNSAERVLSVTVTFQLLELKPA